MCKIINQLDQFRAEVDRKRKDALCQVQRIPISVLIWGPSPSANTKISDTRIFLREHLREKGHIADFSEDLCEEGCPHSLMVQQATQAEAYDIVFSIPESKGSVAEIHDFARIPNISHKIVAFLNSSWNEGYSNRSLMELQAYSTCKIELYNPENLPECVSITSENIISRLQELFYLGGRRSV